jgi:hypothetical protein
MNIWIQYSFLKCSEFVRLNEEVLPMVNPSRKKRKDSIGLRRDIFDQDHGSRLSLTKS